MLAHAQGDSRAARKSRPSTVPADCRCPEVAAADEVLWHVTGMRKYGQVAEAGEDGDYILYELTATEDASSEASH